MRLVDSSHSFPGYYRETDIITLHIPTTKYWRMRKLSLSRWSSYIRWKTSSIHSYWVSEKVSDSSNIDRSISLNSRCWLFEGPLSLLLFLLLLGLLGLFSIIEFVGVNPFFLLELVLSLPSLSLSLLSLSKSGSSLDKRESRVETSHSTRWVISKLPDQIWRTRALDRISDVHNWPK